MSNILDILKQRGFNSQYDKSTDDRTEHQNDKSEEGIEFEETTGLAEKYLKLTIGQLVRVRDGILGLKEWVGILKNLTATAKAEQEMQEKRNDLVPKDFIISHVKKYIDLSLSNHFDIIESQKKIITALYKADPETAEIEIEKMRIKSVTKISKEAIRSINKSVDSLKRKYDSEDK